MGSCRVPTASKKAQLKMKDASNDEKDQLQWKWASGAATTLAEFGTPTVTSTTGYTLCLYNGTTLISSSIIPAGGDCNGKPCWKANGKGFQYKNNAATPEGVTQIKLKSGAAGKAQIQVKAKGANIEMPTLGATLTGPVTVQLSQSSSTVCWQAVYGPPFSKNDGVLFNDKAD
jgi:hypothetical protein